MEEQMPVTMRVEKLREKIDEAVMESRLPPFILEMVIGQYLAGVNAVAKKEYQEDLERWKKGGKKNG